MLDNKKTEKVENTKILLNFSAKVVHGTGHFPMIEKPEKFNELLREAINEFMEK